MVLNSHPGLDDPRWYERAVFYELHTRGFFDSNADGIGDFKGLGEKLDYLKWLGIDCIWLLPFYPSPLHDGGYDISDFMSVAPELGNIEDLAAVIDQAHSRGIRIISDLVMNHTSDEHPWFVESRSSRNNPKADWYVWADDDQGFSEVRVIFCDAEPSNWTYDQQRKQYYWHRFYHQQPDLNYDNPEVADAMLDVVRFWLDLGLDGFRLDAVPYLYKAEGTVCENLPATHELLRRIRREVDASYPNRVLLAEVNQWPGEVAEYFGDGNECHMCFNFPLMPRMFMAIRREQRFPITEIIAQTPTIPEGCQWGLFLRNHDELTLEMVTDEERDYMYREYARDPRMRKNLGIRRRLAPLVDDNRRVAELLYGLLLSLPGSPVLYYGDELLMGDNIYLGDRDSVRTPMQWSPDRNGGFSRADFAALYLPPLMDPVYGYGSVNVEAQQRNRSSFLHWLRRMLMVRHHYPQFATGVMEVLPADNPSVLAYVRQAPERETLSACAPLMGGQEAATDGELGILGLVEGLGPSDITSPVQIIRPDFAEKNGEVEATPKPPVVLCVANLSRFAQPVELSLSRWEGRTPIELLGRVPFPRVTAKPYSFTLAPYDNYWLELVER